MDSRRSNTHELIHNSRLMTASWWWV